MSLTHDICAKALSYKYDDLPDDVISYAKLVILDNLGCAVRGLKEPLTKILSEEFLGTKATVQSLLSNSNRDIHPSLFAQVYGASAHSIDFDDTLVTGMPTHTGSSVVGAILALLPHVKATGQDVITAIVSAYETNSDIGLMLPLEHYNKGFHPTATVGVFAATVAAGRLLKLDLKQMQNAIGIASTQAAGLKSTFGTMSKPFNAGQAGAKGVSAARLAKRGFTGPIDTIESPRGYLSAFLGMDESDRPALETGTYRIMDNMFKLYAACHATHPMIEALRDLQDEHKFESDDIERFGTTVPPHALKTAAIGVPKTGLESKFSFSQMAAMTVCGFNAGSDECFEDSTLDNEDVNAVRKRFTVREVEMDGFVSNTSVTLKSGETHSMSVDLFSIMADKVKVRTRLLEKFMANAKSALDDAQADKLSQNIMSLESTDDVALALSL